MGAIGGVRKPNEAPDLACSQAKMKSEASKLVADFPVMVIVSVSPENDTSTSGPAWLIETWDEKSAR